MSLRLAFVLAAVLPLALSSAALAQDKARTEREQKAIAAFLAMGHKRHLDVMKELGITPGDGYLDCVCHNAGYGSSSTAQFYHPDTIGEFNNAYSCTQPGEPCVVSGFGCMRYPLPSDPRVWESCANGKSPLDALIAGLKGRGTKSKGDYARDLAQCRANWEAGVGGNPALEAQQGYKYLAQNGVPVLSPPPAMATKMKAAIDAERGRMADKVKAATKKAGEDWKRFLAKSYIDTVIKNPAAYAAATTLAEEMTKVEIADLNAAAKAALTEWNRAQKGGLNAGELKVAHGAFQSRMAKIEAERKAHEDALKSFGSLKTGIEVGGDILKAGKSYEQFTSGQMRDKVKAVADTTSLVAKYLDKFRALDARKVADLKKAVETVGLTDDSFKTYEKLLQRGEALEGLSQAMKGTVDAAKRGLQAYSAYETFTGKVAEVEALAASGRYTEAQRNLQAAFKAMEQIGKAGADYLPTGISELMGYYAEAMATPAKFDALIRDIANRGDTNAEIKGDQANTPAMKAYLNDHGAISLDRDDYLFRQAGLSVYKMDKADKGHEYVLLPKAEGPPIYLDGANYKLLAEAAYLWPIVNGTRMTDAEMYDMTYALAAGGKLKIDDLRHKADAKLKEAAADQKIADMYGKKKLEEGDASRWYDFLRAMNAALPNKCTLDAKTQKALFGRWLIPEERGSVLDSLTKYGAALKQAEAGAGGN